jgi:hypothetical protein
MIGSSWSPVVCKWAHPLFTVMCVCLRIVCPTHVVLCFSFVFLRLVYTMLPVFLCFSSSCVPYVASFSSSCVHYVASFSVFFFVLCTLCCQFLCVFLRLVYTMLPVFQEYPFLIALSVFTNVYLTIYHMIKIPVSRHISSYGPAYGKT